MCVCVCEHAIMCELAERCAQSKYSLYPTPHTHNIRRPSTEDLLARGIAKGRISQQDRPRARRSSSAPRRHSEVSSALTEPPAAVPTAAAPAPAETAVTTAAPAVPSATTAVPSTVMSSVTLAQDSSYRVRPALHSAADIEQQAHAHATELTTASSRMMTRAASDTPSDPVTAQRGGPMSSVTATHMPLGGAGRRPSTQTTSPYVQNAFPSLSLLLRTGRPRLVRLVRAVYSITVRLTCRYHYVNVALPRPLPLHRTINMLFFPFCSTYVVDLKELCSQSHHPIYVSVFIAIISLRLKSHGRCM
jgi:hypothetical protein